MVKGHWFPQGSDISVSLHLRAAVFSRGKDSLDDIAQQVVVYQNDIPVGAARLWWANGAFCIGDVGVLSAYRKKGFGDLLIRLLLFKALSHNALQVELSAPPDTAPFFARYGFAAIPCADVSGAVPMRICAEDIALSHCSANCGDGCDGCPHR